MYKEGCFRSLLQSVLPKNHFVSDGFIISSCNDNISTQCDVLVYDAASMPLTDGGVGKFYPVENIYAIGEIKTDLSKTQFKKALRKLAKNKMLAEDRQARKDHNEYEDYTHFDSIPTFLVCSRLMFDLSTLDFETIYKGIDRKYWHNLILSVEDGMISYKLVVENLPTLVSKVYQESIVKEDGHTLSHQYSQFKFKGIEETYNCPTEIVEADENNKYHHIIMFLAALKQAIDTEVRYTFDSISYLGLGFGTD